LWLAILYCLAAYFVLPTMWRHYEHHPAMEGQPKTTETPSGLPGDPLNVVLVGEEKEIVRAFLDAHWYPADKTTLATGLEIAERVVLDRPYPTVPISTLRLWDRRQDLAFEKSSTASPRQREHVRLWRSDDHGLDGRPLWLAAATYDDRVGFSHLTAQITHHIAADVDAERDRLMSDLVAAGQLIRRYQTSGVGPTLNGRNGGGDRYFTDGDVDVGVVSPGNVRQREAPVELSNPPAVDAKNRVWEWIRPLLNDASAAGAAVQQELH
jgi:hypothetical protein